MFLTSMPNHIRQNPHGIYLFFFNDTATTEIYTLSLHDALPIWSRPCPRSASRCRRPRAPPSTGRRSSWNRGRARRDSAPAPAAARGRSEEHTSELQSPCNLVCRLLLEKKKT